MMNTKTFKDYLLESRKSYTYRVKIAGDTTTDFFAQLEKDLARFDLVKFSEPKRSPVMKALSGFPPSVQNEELHIVDIEVNYPASAEQIKQLAVDLGKNPNNIVVVDARFAETEERETAAAEKQGDDALLDSPYEETTQEQAAAAGEYAKGYQTAAANTEQVTYDFAGKTAEAAKYTSDLPQGTQSPLTKQTKKPTAGGNRE